MKIILAGPPRSGKSCLRHALPKAVARVSQDRHYLYVIKGAPDGEGAWFHETCERDDSEAFMLRNEYKYPITEEFTARLEREVACCDAPLTAIDIGGRVSDENRRICRAASHAVLLAGNHPERGPWQERLIEWHRFCEELGIKVIAELQSDYDASQDEITGLGPDGIFRASIHHLERGEPISDRPAILELAKHILRLVQEQTRIKGEPLQG